MDLLSKYKRMFFPSVTDWESNHDQERFKKDWWKLRTPEFLLFSPVAYKWIIFGMVLMAALMFTAVSIYFYIKASYVWAGVFTLLAIRLIWATIQKLRSWKAAQDINLYDLFFRESIIK